MIDNYMDNIKVVRGQRLEKVLETLGINRSSLIDELKFPSSNLSLIIKGKRDIPRKLLDGLSNWKPEINIEWLLTGEGQMLKLQKVGNLSPNENEPLEASATKFSSNLRALMSYHGVDAQGLSPLIELSPEVITQLLEQQCGPSLAILLRLRQHWDISIDALLFQDLSDPENMQNDLKEIVTVEQLRDFMKAFEDLKMKVEKLEKQSEERRREEEEEKKRVGDKKT